MDTVLLVVGVLGFLVALLTTLALNWKLHTSLYSLDDRTSLLEGIVQREVKTRAANERWQKVRAGDAAIEQALSAPVAVPPKKIPWYRNPAITKLPRAG